MFDVDLGERKFMDGELVSVQDLSWPIPMNIQMFEKSTMKFN
jgi:hypothetical protein